MADVERKPISFTNKVLLFMFALMLLLAVYKLGQENARCGNGTYPWLDALADQEKQVPDRIQQGDILNTKDQLVISGHYYLAEYENTDSMLPILDKGSMGIQILVDDNTNLVLGDIVSYRPKKDTSQIIVHRIIGVGIDNQGVYYILKGDNNKSPDPERVRRDQIQRVLVGVLW